jgi:5'-3' exonuclease
VPTEAVYIFNNMLRKLTGTYKPEYMAAVFESLGPTFREQEFAEYKANRPEARGHGTHTYAAVWQQYLAELIRESAR